jgi:thymidylate kinase
VVLGDRSFITTLATRWHRTKVVGERAHFDCCRKLEWAVPLPSDVIYLDVPLEILRQRVESRGRRYGVRDEQVDRLEAAREAYSAIRRSRLPELAAIRWHLVDGTETVEHVATDVADLVLAAAINSTVVAGENPTVGSTVWLPAESVAPGR